MIGLVLAASVHAQDLRYTYDASGNLNLRASAANAAPQILKQPQPQIVEPGNLASFSVVLADTRALSYQWRFNGTNLFGLTNDALFISNATSNSQGAYSVVVTNSSGSVTSAVAQLYLDTDRDGLADSWELTYFGNLTSQRSGGDADNDGASNANEFFDGTNPTNNASRNLRLTILADGGSVATAPTKPNYTNGETVTLTATAFSPNNFYSWTGDLNARTNPAVLTMNSNKTVVAHFQCDPAPNGMVAWWRAENNALDSLGANNGGLSNGLSFAQGQVGQAFLFNATQEVKIAASSMLNVGAGNGLTIEAWIKPSDLVTQMPLVDWNDGSTLGAHFWLNVAFSGQGGPGCFYANLRDINSIDHYFFSPVGVLSTNVWQHIAVTYDRPSGIARLFLNGQTVASATLGNFVPRTTADLHLGYRPGYLSYAGLLDEPAIYNRALTQPEILAIVQADAAGKCNDRPIFTNSAQFADAIQSSAYTQQVNAVRGTAPLVYSLSAGTLPAGLTLSASGLLSGVPTAVGSNVFAMLATDATGLSTELICGLRVLPASPPAMAPGLVAWWRAEANALDSVSTNHGVLTNGATFATGIVGQAFAFNGTTNYVQVGNNPGLNFSNVLSMEAWIFPTGTGSDSASGGGIILSKENQYALSRFADGTIRWAFANTSPGWVWTSSGFVAPVNQWTHVVVVYDNGLVTTYCNGALVQNYGGSGVIGFAQVGQNDFRIGGRQGFNQYFQGRIDEASVYRSVLTSNEVAALFSAGAGGKVVVGPYINTSSLLPDAVSGQGYTQTIAAIRGTAPINFTLTAGALPTGLTLSAVGILSGIPSTNGSFGFTITATDASTLSNRQAFTLQVYGKIPPPAGLVGWWRAETNALDSVGTNNGALINGTTFTSGKVGQAFSLDGLNDYVDIPDGPAVRPLSLTVEAWISANALNSTRLIFAKPVGTTFSDSFALWLENGNLRGVVQDATSSAPTLTAPFPALLGQWHHVAYSFDNSTKQQALYLDGAQVASGVANQTIGYDSHSLLLGRDDDSGNPNWFFSGRMDEAALYNRALSAAEIALIYNAGVGGKMASGPYFATPPALPAAVAGLTYTQALAIVRSSAPVTNTLVSGALPGGLTLSSGGLLSGTPTNVGNFTFTIRVRDAASIAADQQFTLSVLPKVSPSAGLVAWWRAEDNPLDSLGTSDGVMVSGATFAPGKVGRAFSLDGVDDTVEIADSPALHPASVTLESWVLFFNTSGNQHIMAKPLGSGAADSFVMWYESGNLKGSIADAVGGANALSVPFTPVIGRWYHVAFTFDDNSKEQWLYLDGVPIATGFSSRSIGYDNHPVMLGSDVENGNFAFALSGRIDEASIYNRALGALEIAALFNAAEAGKTTSGPYFATPPGLPSGVLSQNYTQSLSAARATLPVTFGLISGALPGGLTLNPSGVLSGTPTNIGSFNFTLRVTDATGLAGEQTFALEVFRQVAPPAGLISWWRAENNGLDSAGTNNGIVTNGTSYAAGEVGRAFALDGVNDYVQIPDAPSLRPASVTLETWVQFAATGTRILIGKPVGGGTSDSYQIYLSGGNLGAFVGDASGTGTQLAVPLTPVLGQWYHVVYTFDDTTLQQVLYLDGVTVASGLGSKRIGYDTQPVLLGADIESGSRAFFLSGRLDEAAIYNRALTAEEVAALQNSGAGGKTTVGPYFTSAPPLSPGVVGLAYAQTITTTRGTPPVVINLVQGALPNGIMLSTNGSLSGTPVAGGDNLFVLRATDATGKFVEQFYTLEVFAPQTPPSGLLAWWKADNNALDSAGTNHGTVQGGTAFSTGEVLSAFDFNGTNAYVVVSNSAGLNPSGPFSLELWLKASAQQLSSDGYFLLIDKSHGFADSTGWAMQGAPNGTVSFFFGLGGGGSANYIGPATPTSLRDDRWHHLAGVFDGTQILLYQDGVLVGATANTTLPVGNTRNVQIARSWGGGSPTRYFRGLLDEISFYSRALTSAEIVAIYNAGPAGKRSGASTSPLVLRTARQGGLVVISFDAIVGKTYTVQSTPVLPTGWTTFSNITALQTNVVFVDSVTNLQRYFRVVTQGN